MMPNLSIDALLVVWVSKGAIPKFAYFKEWHNESKTVVRCYTRGNTSYTAYDDSCWTTWHYFRLPTYKELRDRKVDQANKESLV